jgi:hypothetical protein
MTYEEAREQLLSEGWFVSIWGPSGFCPVQAEGTLPGGEEAYFRARGTRASLEIRKADHTLVAHYAAVVAEWPMAGYLPAERCVELMKLWLATYREKGPNVES